MVEWERLPARNKSPLEFDLVTVPLASLILSVSSANEAVTSTSQDDEDSKGKKNVYTLPYT